MQYVTLQDDALLGIEAEQGFHGEDDETLTELLKLLLRVA